MIVDGMRCAGENGFGVVFAGEWKGLVALEFPVGVHLFSSCAEQVQGNHHLQSHSIATPKTLASSSAQASTAVDPSSFSPP
jgi:hypothetical protein